jgi:cellulose synthase operon protein C
LLGSRLVPALGLLLAAGVLLGSAVAQFAQFPQGPNRGPSSFDPDWSVPASKHLLNAANHVRGKQWAEAIQMYQKVIEQFANRVAALPAEQPVTAGSNDFVLYVDDRWYCHRAIAKLPPEARAIYRKRADAVAERWFRQGQSQRDLTSLRRVVDQAFCSSWGDDALELLGDLAFQDGRFGEAAAAYGRIVADHPDDPSTLVHPDPSVDLARVAAKKLLCRAAAGENPPGPADLDDLRTRYPGATGDLAGRTGAYFDIVKQALESDQLGPSREPDNRWPTFAGSTQRTRIVSGPIDVGSMQWRIDLEKVSVAHLPSFNNPRMGMGTNPISATSERLLAFHPIVLGDQVIVCDGSRVLAYNLNDRPTEAENTANRLVLPVWKYPVDDDLQVPHVRPSILGIPRYTLTAFGNRIYARMAAHSAGFVGGMGGRSAANSIVALDWSTQGKFLWEQRSDKLSLPNKPADRLGNRTVSFEGTPVADERNVYVAVTDRRDKTEVYVACFDADSGAVRWVRYVGAGSPEGEPNNFGFMGGMQPTTNAPGDFNHRLLSLDGSTLYYQTNLGALAALDVATGSTLWVATYPRQDARQLGNSVERDLNPAVIHDGRVFIAPSDADAVFAFDSSSGRMLWKSDRIADDIKLAHLLGVAKGHLVATGNRVVLFDVKTGKLQSAWPDAGKALDGYGRGLLAGDKIYWPTQNEIQILDQRTGMRAEAPIKLLETYHAKGGNLIAGDGYLIVAQAEGLVVFCQNSRLIERYRQQIALAPAEAASYFRLARAAEASGGDELALEMYAKAIEMAHTNEIIDGVPLAAAARSQEFRLLVHLAALARKAGKWDEAADRLKLAVSVTRSGNEQLEAQLLLADVLEGASKPRESVVICQQLLSDDRLRSLPVGAADGHRTVRADLMIGDRLKAIIAQHGRSVYAAFDKEAAALFERGKKEKDPRVLDHVCRAYPEAGVIPDALFELGVLYERAGRLADASHTYKRLQSIATDDDRRVLALWRLAHVYEARQLLISARDAYLELLARFPTKPLAQDGRRGKAGELAAAELARPLYASIVADRPEPPTPLPLFRRWHWQPRSNQPVRTLTACGVVPSLDSGRLFLIENNGLRLLDPLSGAPRWASDLGAPAVWAGYVSDKLIVATAHQIAALELSQGTIQWRFDVSKAGKDARRPDPFANPPEVPERPVAGGPTLSCFQVVNGRVFCLRNRTELIALDGDSGALDWSFSSPPGEINPNLWIGADKAVLQIDKPNQLLVLRTNDGRPVKRTSLGENEHLERPPLPIDENSVILVSDRVTVKRFDLTTGLVAWVFRESEILPTNGPPRLLGSAETLMVLHDGCSLIRLDPVTGKKQWQTLLGTENLSERLGSIACDLKKLYCVNFESFSGKMRPALRVLALDDGSRVWSCPLSGPPNAIWSIALSERSIFAFPIATEYGEMVTMPVVVHRRDDGALIERFVFQTTVSEVTFEVDPRGVILATTKGIWALNAKSERGE